MIDLTLGHAEVETREANQTARVCDEVRRVADAATREHLAVRRWIAQLIVRGAADDVALQVLNRASIKDAAERAWREDVDLLFEEIAIVTESNAAEFFDSALHRRHMDVGDEHRGARCAEQLCQTEARCANTLDRDGEVCEINLTTRVCEASLHRIEAALRGERRRIAAVAHGVAAHHVLRLKRHPVAVLRAHADVFRGDVLARERLDEAPHRARFRFARLMTLRRHDDDALRAAHLKSRRRSLVGHAFRQAKHVVERVAFGRVGPATRAAECVSECGRVNRDDRLEAGLRVVVECHALVAVRLHLSKDVHSFSKPRVYRRETVKNDEGSAVLRPDTAHRKTNEEPTNSGMLRGSRRASSVRPKSVWPKSM